MFLSPRITEEQGIPRDVDFVVEFADRLKGSGADSAQRNALSEGADLVESKRRERVHSRHVC